MTTNKIYWNFISFARISHIWTVNQTKIYKINKWIIKRFIWRKKKAKWWTHVLGKWCLRNQKPSSLDYLSLNWWIKMFISKILLLRFSFLWFIYTFRFGLWQVVSQCINYWIEKTFKILCQIFTFSVIDVKLETCFCGVMWTKSTMRSVI